jgi:hypothetical protein
MKTDQEKIDDAIGITKAKEHPLWGFALHLAELCNQDCSPEWNAVNILPDLAKAVALKDSMVKKIQATGKLPENTVQLPNDTKIRFCNALDALRHHSDECYACAVYIKSGDEDLCVTGKDIIATELAFSDTTIQLADEEN